MKKICILKGSPRKQGNTNALLHTMVDFFLEKGLDLFEEEWNVIVSILN